MERRHKSPDYEIEAWITGVRMPNGKVYWNFEIDGAEDNEKAAGILERVVEILRDKDET